MRSPRAGRPRQVAPGRSLYYSGGRIEQAAQSSSQELSLLELSLDESVDQSFS